MTIDIKTPVFPESIADGVIAKWHKQAGDFVLRDEVLAEIETDKVVLEVPAPQDGVLTSVLKAEGDVVVSSEVLAIFTPGGKPSQTATPTETINIPGMIEMFATEAPISLGSQNSQNYASQSANNQSFSNPTTNVADAVAAEAPLAAATASVTMPSATTAYMEATNNAPKIVTPINTETLAVQPETAPVAKTLETPVTPPAQPTAVNLSNMLGVFTPNGTTSGRTAPTAEPKAQPATEATVPAPAPLVEPIVEPSVTQTAVADDANETITVSPPAFTPDFNHAVDIAMPQVAAFTPTLAAQPEIAQPVTAHPVESQQIQSQLTQAQPAEAPQSTPVVAAQPTLSVQPITIQTGTQAVKVKPVEEATVDFNQSPAVRHALAEHPMDTTDLEGSGRGSRLTKQDVLAQLIKHNAQGDTPEVEAIVAVPSTIAAAEQIQQIIAPNLAQNTPAPSAEPLQTAALQAATTPAPVAAAVSADVPVATPTTAESTHQAISTAVGERIEKRVPMTRLRSKVAERLLAATQQTAMLTTFNEVNMRPIMDMRRDYGERFEKRHGVRLGFMSLFAKASCEALKRFPAVNASIEGNDIVYHGYFDIGVAVSSDRGLVVPVIRNADQMNFAEFEKNIVDFGKQAREGKLSIEDMVGGTFTITNGGVFGSLLSTPIINPPQTAILGMHKIQDRPMAVNGEVVILPMMYLALSYDHRLIDGKEAVQFLATIKALVEDPAMLLLDL